MERFVLDDPLKQRANTKEIAGYVDENGCWICDTYSPIHKMRNGKSKGYGYYKATRVVDGVKKELQMHRYVYETYNQCKIEDNMVIRHKCDNPLCINPNHLEIGTHEENMKDMVERGRSTKGEKSGTAKLSNVQRLEVEELIKEGKETLTSISKRYGVSVPRLCQIKNEMKK